MEQQGAGREGRRLGGVAARQGRADGWCCGRAGADEVGCWGWRPKEQPPDKHCKLRGGGFPAALNQRQGRHCQTHTQAKQQRRRNSLEQVDCGGRLLAPLKLVIVLCRGLGSTTELSSSKITTHMAAQAGREKWG
jgi:hypothetical protein